MTTSDKPFVARGKNIEAAIGKGLTELGLSRREVQIEVLHAGSRGVLGIGAEDAVVALTRRSAVTPAGEAPARKLQADEGPEEIVDDETPPSVEEPDRLAESDPADPADPADTAELGVDEIGEGDVSTVARDLLSELLKHLGVEAEVQTRRGDAEAEDGEEPPLVLDVVGRDLGSLIGRRGETLASLQFVTRLMVSNRIRRWSNLVVDVEGYKARRERMLRELALRMAERASNSGRVVALEAMPARERRIVHMVLRDYPDVTTQSIGEGEGRKVTIIPD